MVTATGNAGAARPFPRLPVFLAVGAVTIRQARKLAGIARETGFGVKIGKEFLARHGIREIRQAIPDDLPLFLDVKYHDIPAVVGNATREVTALLSPCLLTIHAAGGRCMIQAAVGAAGEGTSVVAVTVLTSLDAGDLVAVGFRDSMAGQVTRLARLALENGAAGLVCAPSDCAMLRRETGPEPVIVVPGIRETGSAAGDQKRVATAREAILDGASWLVVGRQITDAPDIAAAAAGLGDTVAAAARESAGIAAAAGKPAITVAAPSLALPSFLQ